MVSELGKFTIEIAEKMKFWIGRLLHYENPTMDKFFQEVSGG